MPTPEEIAAAAEQAAAAAREKDLADLKAAHARWNEEREKEIRAQNAQNTERLNIERLGGEPPFRGSDGPSRPNRRIEVENENFKKSVKDFRFGEGDNFQAWKTQVLANARYYGIEDHVVNRVVWIKAAAQGGYSLVRTLDPDSDPYREMNKEEYLALMQDTFEPAAETENMKLEFQSRHQMPNELPNIYFADKLSMYLRAYPDGQRDWSAFFDQTIGGLTNPRMREKLREWEVVPSERNAQALKDQIVRWAKIIRKSYLLGEISEAEVYGAEATPSNLSYMGNRTVKGLILKPDGTPIKTESVHSINAVTAKKTLGPCWHCKGHGHLMRDCTRKATGFPASVTAVDDGNVNATVEPSTRGGKKPFRPFRRGGGRGRGFKRLNQRVAYLFEDEQGNAYYDLEDAQEEPETTVAAVEDSTEAREDAEEFEGDDDHFLELLGL